MIRPVESEFPLIRSESCILVMIDFQERLVPAMAEKERLLENAVRLARASRILGLPVLVTEQQKLGATVPELRDALGAVDPVSKVEFNGFGSEAFTERVKSLKRNTLILSGIEAHICVAQTALHAVPYYRVHVVADAVSSRAPQNRDIALRRMEQAGVVLSSTEMVIYELLGKAGTGEFREVLKLVK
ncbi:MAG: hydrolase [Thermodesulfobacteriota bacterium]